MIRFNNNIEIPQIGVGTWTLSGEIARRNVRLALEAGFRHVDTAQGYENEAEVGQGIIDSGVPRQEIFLTTNEGLCKGHLAGDGEVCKTGQGKVHRRKQFQPSSSGRSAHVCRNPACHQPDRGASLHDAGGEHCLQPSAGIVQRGLITIPRAKPSHFAENLEIMTFSLSDDDMQAISALNQNLRSNVLNDPETFPW